MSVETVQAEALHLSPSERAQLIDALWDSLASPEVKAREQAWAQESERRVDAFEAGKLPAREATSVFSRNSTHETGRQTSMTIVTQAAAQPHARA